MRRVISVISCLILLASCAQKEPFENQAATDGEQITIRVCMPEDPFSKVSFTAEGSKLKIAWQEKDCIRVISGEESQVFTVSNIISDHEAEFTGTAVSGSSFDILYPGTYASVEAAEEDTTTPTQTGNGTTGHLKYKALLSGVDSYNEVVFKSDWASAHGGSFKSGAAIRLKVTLPGGVTSLKKASLRLNGVDYYLPLSGVDVSESGQVLTAYMMLPWKNIPLADGSSIPIFVLDETNEAYGTAISITGNKTILCGRVNSITGVTLTLSDFVAGDGTLANPYLIANARQLNNMHNVMLDDSSNCFCLLDDIDASSITNWVPLNTASEYSKAMDFDGAGHTISNLSSSNVNFASFSGVLNGHIHDVTFDNATISHTTRIGVVGAYIGYSGIVGNCTDVHVINSSVSGSSSWVGGFAAEINTSGMLEGCSVENTTIEASPSHLGGFAGIVRVQTATLRNCYTRNLTLTHNETPDAARGIGGFVGCTTADASFEGCHVDGPMTISATVAPDGSKKIYVGGFIGYIASVRPAFTNCYVEGSNTDVITISGKAETGGFVGYNDKSATYTDCRVKDVSVSGIYHLGGFMGYGCVSSGYEVPSIFTRCHVQGASVSQDLASDSGSVHTGGFAGNTAQALTFIDCSVTGTSVTATKAAVQNVGGFVGCTTYAGANFQGCTVDNTSSVTAKANSVGGFVGWSYVPDAYKECSSAATVNNAGSNTGGFVGHAQASSLYTNCSASGNVTSSGAYSGGFVGRADVASFTACHYDTGTVDNSRNNANTQVGGFVGGALTAISFNGCYVSSATISAANAGRTGGFAGQLGSDSAGGNNVSTVQCYVSGTSVEGSTNTGGFVGVQYEGTTRCYVNGGTLTACNSQAGGFSAFIQNCNVTHCYTTTTVNGGSYSDIGGFAGRLNQGGIHNCFSSGTQNGTGGNRAAFIAACKNASGSISNCIGWHSTLSFCGSNDVSATITNGYAGTSGTISSQAAAQSGWVASVWNLDAAQPVLIPGSTRIPAVFIGDSITWQWARVSRTDSQQTIIDETHGALGNEPLPDYMSLKDGKITTKFHPGFFSGNGYVDKGISGQNTTQMRARFEKDVIALNPRVFVIMGGTNDIAQGVSEDTIFENIEWMANEARTSGIEVVICSVTPNNRDYGKVGRKAQYVEPLNVRLKNLADTEGYAWCDYWSALVARTGDSVVPEDIDHGLKDCYKLYDDLHPGPAAYTVMERIIKPLIEKTPRMPGDLNDFNNNPILNEEFD